MSYEQNIFGEQKIYSYKFNKKQDLNRFSYNICKYLTS